MLLTKELLEELYSKMSLGQMAKSLGIARSTLYYHMDKMGIARRSKSAAQKQHLLAGTHQRLGVRHSDLTKDKISDARREFWDSPEGMRQREALAALRRKEWNETTRREQNSIVSRLHSAPRPMPGELSHFGHKLANFLATCEKIQTGIRLTPDHVSDIILVERRVVLELLLPISVYGEQEQRRVEERYSRLQSRLNDAGYRVVVIEDRSNSISTARCKRVYDQLLEFFATDQQNSTIQS
jgi:AcrR family transcriptional regulator